MPSFYPNTLPRQMPLTPPEYSGSYLSGVGIGSQSGILPYTGHNGLSTRYDPLGSCYEYAKRYPHSTFAASYNKQAAQSNAQSAVGLAAHPENLYGPIAAPILPPIRIPEPPAQENNYGQYQRQHGARANSEPQPKDEKTVGGVSAHLDYEMEQMSDFVAEMAQGMYDLYISRICLADIDIIRSVHPNTVVPPAFRKYVSQILSSTRLPSSTILLGLHYLATRMGMLSAKGRYSAGSGQVYRMLTTALLLGSKFLDDNTFQNRSWSEVSNIPVAELNVLEIEWLLAIDWNMHINPDDSYGFISWRQHWVKWQAKKVENTLDSLKLTPLDAEIRRQRSVSKQFPPAPMYPRLNTDVASRSSFIDHLQAQWQIPRYDQWSQQGSLDERSPPSAPETGPNTPEWYGRMGTFGQNYSAPAYSTRAIPPPARITPSSTQLGAYHTPYAQHYPHGNWGGHGTGCGCVYCSPRHDQYFMAPGHGPQTVAG